MVTRPLRQSSHIPPISISWEDEKAKITPKSLILLVGAAGFEPATWSTQNSRATRLRYTPPAPRWAINVQWGRERKSSVKIDTRFTGQQQCVVGRCKFHLRSPAESRNLRSAQLPGAPRVPSLRICHPCQPSP